MAGILGSIISGTYLIVNIMEIPGKIKEVQYFKQTQEGKLQTENKQSDIKENVKGDISQVKWYTHQFSNFFKSISYDLSAITPFLLMWFFAAISLNTYNVIKGSLKKEQLYEKIDTLPMPPGYETTWIQLGFIGTLWGFMLIGWKMKGVSVGESAETLDILLKAFGTALLSTFTAVVLAYVFAPVAKGVWRWIHNISDHEIIGRPDIEVQLKVLSGEMKKTTEAIGSLNKEIESFESKISVLSPDKVISLLEKISNNMANLGPSISMIDTSIKQEMPKVNATIKEEVSNVSTTIKEETEKGVSSIIVKLSGIDEKLKNVSEESGKQTQTIKTVMKDVGHDMQKVFKDGEEKIKVDIKQTESQISMTHDMINTMENNLKAFIDTLKIKVEVPSFNVITEKLEQIKRLVENTSQKIGKTRSTITGVGPTDKPNLWTKLTSWIKR